MSVFVSIVALVVLVVLVVAAWRQRHKRFTPGPGAAGSVYEFLNEDKRAALEIVVEERAAYREPEDRDGNLPQLESPTGPGRSAPDQR